MKNNILFSILLLFFVIKSAKGTPCDRLQDTIADYDINETIYDINYALKLYSINNDQYILEVMNILHNAILANPKIMVENQEKIIHSVYFKIPILKTIDTRPSYNDVSELNNRMMIETLRRNFVSAAKYCEESLKIYERYSSDYKRSKTYSESYYMGIGAPILALHFQYYILQAIIAKEHKRAPSIEAKKFSELAGNPLVFNNKYAFRH